MIKPVLLHVVMGNASICRSDPLDYDDSIRDDLVNQIVYYMSHHRLGGRA